MSQSETQSEQSENNNVDITRPLTRKQFCVAENISLSTYAKLRRLGRGPKETHYPGMNLVRISPEARQKWHSENEKWNKSKAADLEQARRIALASAAGKKAAKSERHVSKRKKAAKAAKPRRK
jgi:hypothetical protein